MTHDADDSVEHFPRVSGPQRQVFDDGIGEASFAGTGSGRVLGFSDDDVSEAEVAVLVQTQEEPLERVDAFIGVQTAAPDSNQWVAPKAEGRQLTVGP